MKNNLKINSGWSDSNIGLVVTKEEKLLDQLQPLSSEVADLITEDGETFIDYMKSIGLSEEKRMMVLPSVHHYYYEKEEMTGVKTLVNMKCLNRIEHPDSFLENLSAMLQPDTNFIGCFSNNRKRAVKPLFSFGKISMFLEKVISYLDSRILHFMNKNEVFSLLEKHGFSIVDMTDINGLTYFYSQNAPSMGELKASVRSMQSYN